jgi:2,3-dihydroxybenzoate decarboxylase
LNSQQKIYEGHAELLGPAWAFGVETATHVLRLITSGLFDRFPKLTVIIGHLGEGLAPSMWRAQNRFNDASFGKKLKKPLSQYLKDNFYITTSGNFHTPTLLNVIAEMGADRVLFAIDYPYERTDEAVAWFDNCAISDEDRQKIGRLNALRIFKLKNRAI